MKVADSAGSVFYILFRLIHMQKFIQNLEFVHICFHIHVFINNLSLVGVCIDMRKPFYVCKQQQRISVCLSAQ